MRVRRGLVYSFVADAVQLYAVSIMLKSTELRWAALMEIRKSKLVITFLSVQKPHGNRSRRELPCTKWEYQLMLSKRALSVG